MTERKNKCAIELGVKNKIQKNKRMKKNKKLTASDLPKGYHVQYNEGKKKYFWYYKAKNAKNDARSKKYTSYSTAISDAIKHFSKSKKTTPHG